MRREICQIVERAMNQPENHIFLSIVIPTYNRLQGLESILRSIKAQFNHLQNIEIIVVNNDLHLSEAVEDTCRNFIESGLLLNVYHQPLIGGSHARNMGIEHAKGSWIAFIDDDEELIEGYLQTALGLLKDAAETSIFGGPYLPVFDCEVEKWVNPQYYSVYYGEKARDLSPREFFGGGNMIFPKSMLVKIGNFSTDLGHVGNKSGYGEDTELLMRAVNAGAVQKYYPELAIYHHIPENKLNLQWLIRQKKLSSISKARLYFMYTPPAKKKVRRFVESLYFFRQTVAAFFIYLAARMGEPFRNKEAFPFRENYRVEVVLPRYAKYRINLELFRSIFSV